MLVKPLIYYLAAVLNRITSKGYNTDCVGTWFMLLLKCDLIDYINHNSIHRALLENNNFFGDLNI